MNPFDNLPDEWRHLIAIPPHPWVLRVAQENLDFERAMLSLAACVPYDLQSVTIAFKRWVKTRPLSWRDGASYSLDYFRERGRFPFEIDEWPEVIGE